MQRTKGLKKYSRVTYELLPFGKHDDLVEYDASGSEL